MEPSHRSEKRLAFVRKMTAAGLDPLVIDTFSHYYDQLVSGATGLVYGREIRPVGRDEIPAAEDLAPYADHGEAALVHSSMIILNGGLGTSMGLSGPKSLLPVKEGKNFLEIILSRAARAKVRLALMNSYNTETATAAAVAAADPAVPPLAFLQHKFPKILQKDLTPATWPAKPELEWNPPGHGDIYTALQTSGMLQRLLDEGVEFAFISNSDNLGAFLDTGLLGYFAVKGCPFMMEVCEKTAADVKGGHLARQADGRLILREAAQCPPEEQDAFENIRVHRFFNTNNLWINLTYLRDLVAKKQALRLPMIVNPKTLDPRDPTSPPVFQVETAMGAAISLFDGATAVQVPRSRFFPVKTCNDLMAVRSDMYLLTADHCLTISPQRDPALGNTITIDLDPEYYGKIDRFEKRFPHGVPSLVGCRSLTVRGEVIFEAGVTIESDVCLTNTANRPAFIPEGSVLRGEIVL